MEVVKNVFRGYAFGITIIMTILFFFTLCDLRETKVELNEIHLEMDKYQYEVLGLNKRIDLREQE